MSARRYGYPRETPGPRPAAGGRAPGDTPHCWDAGPGPARPLARPYARGGVRYTHRLRWCLDRVAGTTRTRAARQVAGVLAAPGGWRRAGLVCTRVWRPADADILVRVIPRDTTACGPGAAGCWSWDGVPGEPAVAEIGVEYLDDPVAFATIANMEIVGHGVGHFLDMYNPQHQPYRGSLGTWEQARTVGGFPTAEEIDALRLWLQGKTDPRLIHDD